MQGETPPGPSIPSVIVVTSPTMKECSLSLDPLGSNRDARTLDHETSTQERLASLVPSSGSEGSSDPEDFSSPSPPLTRGRKTNKERREKEATSNIFLGSQKWLDPFIQGNFTSPPN